MNIASDAASGNVAGESATRRAAAARRESREGRRDRSGDRQRHSGCRHRDRGRGRSDHRRDRIALRWTPRADRLGALARRCWAQARSPDRRQDPARASLAISLPSRVSAPPGGNGGRQRTKRSRRARALPPRRTGQGRNDGPSRRTRGVVRAAAGRREASPRPRRSAR